MSSVVSTTHGQVRGQRSEGVTRFLGIRPQDLASQMHTAWIRFARDGEPGWRAFDQDYPVRIFRDASPAVELDPRGDERRIWPSL